MLPPPTLKDDPDVAHDIAQRAYLELSSLPPTFADPSFLENYVPLKSRPIKDQIDQLSTRKADVRSTEMEQRDSAIISKLGAEFRHHAQQESGLVEDICIPGEVERKRDSKAELEARKEYGQKLFQAALNERQSLHYKYLTLISESRQQSITDLAAPIELLEALLKNTFPRSETDFDELNRIDQQMGLEVAKYLFANAEVRQSMMKKHAAERLWREEDTAPLINFLDKNPEFQSKVKVLVDSKSAGLDPRRGRK